MSENLQKSAVDIALDEDRKKSEIKAILQDLERLKTVPLDRRRRWVWELLQNAKDCAHKEGTVQNRTVNVSITLFDNQITFSHDGVSFTLNDLLALVRRTSTKSFDNSDGKTGKFGTGFVTTHALNHLVTVSGLLQGKNGLVNFTIPVDRRSDNFNDLEVALNEVFNLINSFFEANAEDFTESIFTIYSYELDLDSLALAQTSLNDFTRNLPFVLLINSTTERSGIGSLAVKTELNTRTYSLSPAEEIYSGILFSELKESSIEVEGYREGLIHYSNNNLTIAVPAKYKDGSWVVQRIEKEIKLYKEFPLVGTETWNIPFMLHSSEFLPSEPRDGIRTYKDNENRIDTTADANRDVFICYRDSVIKFFSILQSAPIGGLYLLSECGLPLEKIEYTSDTWYTENIQKPLRDFFTTHHLLVSAAGLAISLPKAKIPRIFEKMEDNLEFYQLAAKYFHNQFPEEATFIDWQRIYFQDSENWEINISVNEEDLLKHIIMPGALETLKLSENETKTQWLNQLINFLHRIGRHDLADSYPIYPNTKGEINKKEAVRKDNILSSRMKDIGDTLGQKVYDILVHPDIEQLEGIDVLDRKAYFTGINTYVGSLTPSADNLEKYKAVFTLVSMFPNDLSKERNKWYLQLRQLLPEIVPEKQMVDDMEDFSFGSAETASIKYVCWLIENEKTFKTFCNTYFQDDNSSAYTWLNTMIEILYRTADYQALLTTNAIIPMQNGNFRKFESTIFREDKKAKFDDLLKILYTTYLGKGDAKFLLIDNEITVESLPWTTADILTKPLDELFIAHDIQEKVEAGAELNPLFHSLNDWFGENEEERGKLFPHFKKERPILYVKAFGPEVSKMVIALSKIDKTAEEIQALAELDMSAKEINLLINASKMAGGTAKLLIVAHEIRQAAEDAEWRKAVGDAAENAFKAAISEIQTLDIKNPDVGYDFEILHPRNQPFYLEIKSTVAHNETVKMSRTQGKAAKDYKSRYALCVLLREQHDTLVDKDYFIANARFVLNIGDVVEQKVLAMEQGLKTIGTYNEGTVQTRLDNDTYSVNVSRSTWREYLSFSEFILYLSQQYFNISL
ncbi:sacsin N-terminal ATP-binding-like domain-containing protein [Flavobacterium subsaxonicum]|uniref:Protein NO VEIN C-terminal domain-containing protein n=1 Tax=Flavobacterium subsaxonicum WB 4.1-42 = DSM 21790 TaxID=1121898 RepID=A0A0A2MHS7_9FLAO|nr:DUF3883 domain-containing protein [Flavobacterium subsaxonicum]KGO91023.1 hypothetical protein Q766_20255 [Flavobacterium subsaxonicum WB 4.1-42 = DSM 21790]